jgi:predicted transcriptional regulator
MDEKKALRISNREQAVELFATNPDIEAKRVAEMLDVTPQVVYEYRRDPNFHMQVQDRFMAELENDIPSMVSALKREVLAGNVQATRLMFEYMNKLQKNINITIDSPFENWMKKQEFGEVVDAEIIVNMEEFKELPPRTANNSHLEVHKERLRVQNAPQKAKSIDNRNNTRREQYKWVKRAKAVGIDKLPGKRPTPGQKKAWQKSIIKLEKKA